MKTSVWVQTALFTFYCYESHLCFPVHCPNDTVLLWRISRIKRNILRESITFQGGDLPPAHVQFNFPWTQNEKQSKSFSPTVTQRSFLSSPWLTSGRMSGFTAVSSRLTLLSTQEGQVTFSALVSIVTFLTALQGERDSIVWPLPVDTVVKQLV